MTTRHEFLTQLHALLQPKAYLEIGVQHGWSLQLSMAPVTIGIDPNPTITVPIRADVIVARATSDEFFEPDRIVGLHDLIDLAFIDGMHLAEYALRDFNNVEKHSHSRTVVVFDDVLPTTVEMASREECPGDWTGDVWKVYDTLRVMRRDLVLQLVDTQPTGVLVVTSLDPNYAHTTLLSSTDETVPDRVLDRRHAWSATAVIDNLRNRGFGT